MIRWFLSHPTASNLLMLLIVGLGIQTLPKLVRTSLPDTRLGEIEIRVAYPGATPKDVEDAICRKLEDSVEGIPGIEEILCTAESNRAVMRIPSLEGADFQRLIQDVKTAVDTVKDLPRLSEKPEVVHINRLDPVVTLAIGAPMPESELKLWAEKFKQKLKASLDAGALEIIGFSDHQLRMELDEEKLLALGIGAEQVRQAIEREGIRVPLGTLRTRPEEYSLRLLQEPDTLAKLGEIIVFAEDGYQVRLEDLGELKDTFEETAGRVQVMSQQGKIVPGFLIEVRLEPTRDSLNLVEQVQAFLQKQTLPPGMTLEVTADQSVMIRDRLQMLVKNGLGGFVLVLLVLCLFFGVRFAFWVVLGLPVSFLGALWLMPQLDQTINMLTMVGLLLGIGILMDDATVISENIATRVSKGEDPLEAAIRGTQEVFHSVLSSFLTTASMFGGLIFIGGDIGRVLKVMPLVLLLVLSVSLIEAFLILPHHVKDSLKNQRPMGSFRKRFEDAFQRFRDIRVQSFLRFCVRYRHRTLALAIVLFFSGLALIRSGLVRGSVFPDLEGNAIVARILLPPGSEREEINRVLKRSRDALLRVSDRYEQGRTQNILKAMYWRVGQHPESGESGLHAASLMVELLNSEKRWFVLDDFLHDWRREIGDVPGILSIVTKEPSFGPGGKPFELRIKHPDTQVLLEASKEIRHWLATFEGVSGITDDMKSGAPELVLSLLPGAQEMGVSASYLASEIRSRLQGGLARRVQSGSEDLEITVQVLEEHRQAADFLQDMLIPVAQRGLVPLTELVSWHFERGLSRIPRVNSQRALHVSCEIDARVTNSGAILNLFRQQKQPDLIKRWPDLQILMEGKLKAGKESGESIRNAMLMGVFGVFLILSFQFGSFREPLLVMAVIPFALFGVLSGHFIMGYDLSLPSVVGFVSLIGVVVNNSILLVHFMYEHLQESESMEEAVIEACIRRFRPIVITTSTTIAGMLPMLFERSLQAQILIPLVISLVFGLLAGSVLVLLVLPCLYCTLEDLGVVFQKGS